MNAELLDILKAIQIDIRKADVRDILKDIQADLQCFHEKIDAYIEGDGKTIVGRKKKRSVKAVKAPKAVKS
jgi:hypothetical protein